MSNLICCHLRNELLAAPDIAALQERRRTVIGCAAARPLLRSGGGGISAGTPGVSWNGPLRNKPFHETPACERYSTSVSSLPRCSQRHNVVRPMPSARAVSVRFQWCASSSIRRRALTGASSVGRVSAAVPQRRGDLPFRQKRPGREAQRVLENAAKLAHVAAPLVPLQKAHRLWIDCDTGIGRLSREPAQPVANQRPDIFPPLPERRDVSRCARQPEVEVLPKSARRDVVGQHSVRGGNHSNVNEALGRLAEAPHVAILEASQEPRLDRRRDLRDFVEEQSATVGGGNEAARVLGRAGERALPMPEQLPRTARREWPRSSRARTAGGGEDWPQNRARDEFPARPCLTRTSTGTLERATDSTQTTTPRIARLTATIRNGGSGMAEPAPVCSPFILVSTAAAMPSARETVCGALRPRRAGGSRRRSPAPCSSP